MINSSNILLLVFAYLVGSIPTSVWIGKLFFKTDIRDHGSGNAGTTNTIRVLGVKPGITVFIVDVLKGWFAVYLANFNKEIVPGSDDFYIFSIILGLLSAVGHLFPVFASFRGGKGVATALGVGFGLHPLSAGLILIFFIIVFLISRIVSLSSMLSGLFYPVLLIFIFKISSIPMIIFSLIIPVVLLITHKNNLKRLIRKEEPKFSFTKRIQDNKPDTNNK